MIFEKLRKYRINGSEWCKFPNMDETVIDKLIEDTFSCYKSFMSN